MESVLCSLFWKGYPLGDIRPLSGKHLLFTLEALDDPVCGAAESDARRSTINQNHRLRDRDLLDYRLSFVVSVRRVRSAPRSPLRFGHRRRGHSASSLDRRGPMPSCDQTIL